MLVLLTVPAIPAGAQTFPYAPFVAWNPTGDWLAVGQGTTLNILDANSLTVVNTLSLLRDQRTSTAWSPDGRYLALINGPDVELWADVWDPVQARRVVTYEYYRYLSPPQPKQEALWVTDVVWSPDGTQIAVDIGVAIDIVDAETGVHLRQLFGAWADVYNLDWSVDGRLVLANWDRIAYVVDPLTGTIMNYFYTGRFATLNSSVWSVAFSPDGATLAVGTTDGTIALWANTLSSPLNNDTPDKVLRNRASERHSGYVEALAWSPTGQYLVSGGQDGTIRFWDARTGQQVQLITVGEDVWTYSVAWNPDGSRLAYANPDGTVAIFDATQLPDYAPLSTDTPTETPAGTAMDTLKRTVTDTASAAPTDTPGQTPNLLQNSDFSSGTTGWYTVGEITNGVFEFYRSGQSAALLQNTGAALPVNTPVEVRADFANSSPYRKRVTFILHDEDWSDQQACTFWLEPNAPMRTYSMRTYTTEAWTSAELGIYEATSDGSGWIGVDNVVLRQNPEGLVLETHCIDPTAPAPGTGTDSDNLVANGTFSEGLSPWYAWEPEDTTYRLSSGVMEFYRIAGANSAGIIQNTGTRAAADTALELRLELGNSSSSRKRVTVVLNDTDWSDLQACWFWLPANMPPSTYVIRTYAIEAWADLNVSVYDTTSNGMAWIQLDNVEVRRRPTMPVTGVSCYEPGAVLP